MSITLEDIETAIINNNNLAIYPSQSGNAGKFLSTDGTSTSWSEVQTSDNGESSNADPNVITLTYMLIILTDTIQHPQGADKGTSLFPLVFYNDNTPVIPTSISPILSNINNGAGSVGSVSNVTNVFNNPSSWASYPGAHLSTASSETQLWSGDGIIDEIVGTGFVVGFDSSVNVNNIKTHTCNAYGAVNGGQSKDGFKMTFYKSNIEANTVSLSGINASSLLSNIFNWKLVRFKQGTYYTDNIGWIANTFDVTSSTWAYNTPVYNTANVFNFSPDESSPVANVISKYPITKVDPQSLTNAVREGITYGDRRFSWIYEDNFLVRDKTIGWADRAFGKLINGSRKKWGDDSGSGDAHVGGDSYAPYWITTGGHFTITPCNGVYYKFRGMYWVDDQPNRLPSSSISETGDARFAAFGYRDGRWFWLGTCSNNNTDVDPNNHSDIQIPTSNWIELEWTDFSYGTLGEANMGYPKKWEWTENIDFYEKYCIKHVKMGTIGGPYYGIGYQASDNIYEFEFF